MGKMMPLAVMVLLALLAPLHALAASPPPPPLPACPPGSKRSPRTLRCIGVYNSYWGDDSYWGAKAACRAAGGRLASVATAAEVADAVEACAASAIKFCWVFLVQPRNASSPTTDWYTGTECKRVPFNPKFWAPGQPDYYDYDKGAREQCAVLGFSGSLIDSIDCNWRFQAVCDVNPKNPCPVVKPPVPTTTPRLPGSAGWALGTPTTTFASNGALVMKTGFCGIQRCGGGVAAASAIVPPLGKSKAGSLFPSFVMSLTFTWSYVPIDTDLSEGFSVIIHNGSLDTGGGGGGTDVGLFAGEYTHSVALLLQSLPPENPCMGFVVDTDFQQYFSCGGGANSFVGPGSGSTFAQNTYTKAPIVPQYLRITYTQSTKTLRYYYSWGQGGKKGGTGNSAVGTYTLTKDLGAIVGGLGKGDVKVGFVASGSAAIISTVISRFTWAFV